MLLQGGFPTQGPSLISGGSRTACGFLTTEPLGTLTGNCTSLQRLSLLLATHG